MTSFLVDHPQSIRHDVLIKTKHVQTCHFAVTLNSLALDMIAVSHLPTELY